jgi:glycosyltransferase involved in cell wall biosynthesis
MNLSGMSVSGGVRKAKVMHLLNRLNRGGQEVLVYNLVRELNKLRYEHIICCLKDGGGLKEEVVQSGIKVIALDLPRRSIFLFPIFLYDIFRIARKMSHLILEKEVSLIQTHLPHTDLLGCLVGRLTQTPVVMSFASNNMLSTVWGKGPLGIKFRLRMSLLRSLSRSVKKMITVGENVSAVVNRALRPEPGKLQVVRNGVFIPRVVSSQDRVQAREKLGLAAENFVITCVGRLVSFKGQDLLVEAVKIIVKQHPEVRLLLVGGGPQKDSIQALVGQSGLKEKVLVLGERTDVPDILMASDLFVLPSFWEGISIALLEAMSYGLPVVASDVPGNREVLGSQGDGILVPPKDTLALKEAIVSLLEKTDLRRRMGQKSRARVERYFNFADTVAGTEEVYESVLEG